MGAAATGGVIDAASAGGWLLLVAQDESARVDRAATPANKRKWHVDASIAGPPHSRPTPNHRHQISMQTLQTLCRGIQPAWWPI